MATHNSKTFTVPNYGRQEDYDAAYGPEVFIIETDDDVKPAKDWEDDEELSGPVGDE